MEAVLRGNSVIWIAEYNNACIKELEEQIGPNDTTWKEAQLKAQFTVEQLKTTHQLHLHKEEEWGRFGEDFLIAFFWHLKNQGVFVEIESLVMPDCRFSGCYKAAIPYMHCAMRNLSTFRCEYVSNIIILTQGCHNIQTLNLSESDITDSELKSFSEECHILYNINLTGCKNITDLGLKSLSEGCHYLKVLNLCNTGITDEGLQFLGNGCPNIQKLNLSHCNITDSGVQFIAESCHYLKVLNLHQYNTSNITDKGLQFLGNGCSSLEKLDLSILSSVDTTSTITDSGLKFLGQGCSNLHELVFFSDQITDNGLQFLVEGCHNIQNLNLSGYSAITDTTLQILHKAHQLHKIDLPGHFCNLKLLIEMCNSIQHLDLAGSDITDSDLEFLASQNHKIQTLNLRECRYITKQGMKFVVAGGIHNLKLSIWDDYEYSMPQKILKLLANIQSLDLYWSGITDSGLQYLAEACPTILKINLHNCGEFTESGFMYFVEKCTNIQHINIYRCHQVTISGLKCLVKNCPNIKQIVLPMSHQAKNREINELFNETVKLLDEEKWKFP